MRGVAWLVLLAACGRLGFAPQAGDATDGVVPDAGPCAADPALIACYPFEGTTNDATGQHDPIASGAISYVPGKHGQAIHLAPVATLLVAESPALDPTSLTIETWVLLDALPAMRMGLVDNNNEWGFFVLPSGGLHCATRTPGASIVDGGTNRANGST